MPIVAEGLLWVGGAVGRNGARDDALRIPGIWSLCTYEG
jgi:hypothetical protein